MPIARVQMPDGRIARIEVPEGTTPEQATAMARNVVPKSGPKPTSFWQGFKEELAAGANNAESVLAATNPIMAIPRLAQRAITGKDNTSRGKRLDTIERSIADAPVQGSTLGRIAGGIVATAPTMLIPGLGGAGTAGRLLTQGAAQGGAGGAMLSRSRSVGGVARDAGIGAGAGALGAAAGRYIAAPVAERIGRTRPVRKVAEATVNLANKAIPRKVSLPPLPRYAPAERLVNAQGGMGDIRAAASDAQRLGLPLALADTDPRLRALAGSASRFSPDVRATAERELSARSLGQADRAVNAIDQTLAPVTNIEQRAGQIRQKAWDASDPLYKQAFAENAPVDDDLAEILRRPAGQAALRNAYDIARNEGKDPAALGFIWDERGNISLRDIVANERGRYQRLAIPKEWDEVGRETLRGYSGREVAKRGPTDLVGWLRRQGGIKDQRGELRHMGLNNAARKMDFAGQEQRFGPLVSDQGMDHDYAALRAWEAGYFPEFTDRPSVNDFLDALRGTHEGWNRRFLPEDMPTIERFNKVRDEAGDIRQIRFETGNVPVRDTSEAADWAPSAPDSSYVQEVSVPTMETLDYIKQGLDAELGKFRNPLTQKLDLEGNKPAQAVNSLLQDYKAVLDRISPKYSQARATYAEQIAPRTALRTGYSELPRTNVPRRQFDAAIAGMDAAQLPEAQRGFATALADQVAKQRLSRNPLEAIYGSPLQQGKVAALFPEGAPDFNRVYQLEGDMAKTAQEVLGGSQTQPRAMADAEFAGGVTGDLAEAGLVGSIAGGPAGAVSGLANAARRYVGDRAGLGLFGAKAKADAIGPALLQQNPGAILAMLDEIMRKNAEMEARKAVYARAGGLLALPAASSSVVLSR